MKKRILNFQGFVNESKKLNEGGGAGVTFTIDSVTLNATYEITASDIKVKKVESNMSDTFDAIGYDDGMRDVGSWLLVLDDSAAKNIKRSDIADIKLEMYELFDLVEEVLGENEPSRDEEELSKKYETIGDLFKADDSLVLTINVDLAYRNCNETVFGGWVRGNIKKGDVLIGRDRIKHDVVYEKVTINDVELYINNESVGEFVDTLTPIIKAGNKFPSFWESTFRNQDKEYRSYVERELEYNVTDAQEFDDEVQDYIDSSDLGVTVDEFKKDYEKYKEDFLDYWMDKKYDYFWDPFISGMKDIFGALPD